MQTVAVYCVNYTIHADIFSDVARYEYFGSHI